MLSRVPSCPMLLGAMVGATWLITSPGNAMPPPIYWVSLELRVLTKETNVPWVALLPRRRPL